MVLNRRNMVLSFDLGLQCIKERVILLSKHEEKKNKLTSPNQYHIPIPLHPHIQQKSLLLLFPQPKIHPLTLPEPLIMP